MAIMTKSIITLFLSLTFYTILTSQAFSHGNHGGNGETSIEGELASGSHIHLPVKIESSGEIVFGYEALSASSEHEDGHEDEEVHHENSFHIAPTIVIGGDKIKRFSAFNDIIVHKSKILQRASTNTSYLKIKNSKLLWGFGAELHKHIKLKTLGIGIGLNYLKNHSAYYELIIESKHEERSIKVPTNLQEFNHWKIGEKIVFSTNGSIVLTAGTGIDPIIHGGLILSAGGNWQFKLQKISHAKLSVQVTSSRTKSFGAEVDGSFVVLSIEKFKTFENALQFELDINHPESFKALNEAYNGNFKKLQTITKKFPDTAQVNISSGKSNSKGISLALSIPFLYGTSLSQYTGQTYSQSYLQRGQIASDANHFYSTIITRETNSKGVLSKHKKDLFQFSTTFVDENHDGHRDQYYAANFKWHYETDNTNSESIKTKLLNLENQLGILELSDLIFPEKELGHLKISFDFSLSELDLFNMINLLASKEFYLKNKLTISQSINEYLINEIHFSKSCEATTYNNAKFITYEERFEYCKQNLISETFNEIKSLQVMASKATVAIKGKMPSNATMLIAKIGNTIFHNRFILEQVSPVLFNAESRFSIQGEIVKKQTIELL